jgi:hypothetical protein
VLRDDPESLKVNMEAWNRWAVTVAEEGRGRLYPVGDVILDDLDWAASQLHALAAGGVRVVRVLRLRLGVEAVLRRRRLLRLRLSLRVCHGCRRVVLGLPVHGLRRRDWRGEG